MAGHWQRVENVRSSDMSGDEQNGSMGIVRSSDKAGYELRMYKSYVSAYAQQALKSFLGMLSKRTLKSFRFRFRPKKFKTVSCLCTVNNSGLKGLEVIQVQHQSSPSAFKIPSLGI